MSQNPHNPAHEILLVPSSGPQSDPNTLPGHPYVVDELENNYLDDKVAYGDGEDLKGDSGGVEVVGVEGMTAMDKHLQDVEAMEQRIADGTAPDSEYVIQSSHDVATRVLSTFNDPTLQAFTFRSLFLGLGFSAFGAVLAQLYYFKPQTINVSQSFLLILVYFAGKGMEYGIPSRGIFRYLNPGPFNIKEHAAAIICCTTAANSAVAIQVISVQDLFYSNEMNAGTAIFTLLSSQLIGYGFAGILQSVCVYPSMALWPAKISVANTFQALHFDGGISSKRLKFFWGVFVAIFVWEIIPQWIFPLLSAVSIVCLVNHTSPVLRNVFGGGSNNEGMGFFSWCFDWNLITSANLYTPLWTQINIDIGIALTYVLMCAVYYGNYWNGLSFPFMSQAIFNADGTEYNQTLILDSNGHFDPTLYEAVGPAYYSATNALFLVVDNLSIGAALVQVFLWNWKDLAPLVSSIHLKGMLRPSNPFKGGLKSFFYGAGEGGWTEGIDDEHYQVLSKSTKPIPQWWYTLVLIGAFAMAMATNYAGDSGMPWWALIVVLIIAFVFTIVYSFLAAVLGFTQFSSGGTGLYSLLGAYMVPGRPVANMYFAMYGNNPQVQAVSLLQDLKLGQYIKIPPRVTFTFQMLGTVVGAVLNYIIMKSVIAAQRPALLSIAGTRLWSGQNAQSYNSNAVAWGALGPEIFAAGKTYSSVPAALGIGLLLPLPFYLAYRLKPNWVWLSKINPAIITQYSCYMSVGINSSVWPALFMGFFSQYYFRVRFPRAFTKYNYLFAGAMDGGTQTCIFVLSFAVQGASGVAHPFPYWWGNPDPNVLSTDRCLVAGA